MEHSLTWNYLIAMYLFTAGLSSGAAIIASLGDVVNNMNEKVKRVAAYLAPFPVMLGLLCLVLDLHRPWNFYQVLIHYNASSVMSWGAFFLLVYPVLGFIYAATVYWNRKGRGRMLLAWLNLVLGVAIGVYAGLLLAAIYNNPLWSNPLIAFLFFISALSTGLCMVIIGGKVWDKLEQLTIRKIIPHRFLPAVKSLQFDQSTVHRLIRIDGVIIILELFLISTLIISYALRPTGETALGILVTGGYYLVFWIGVVLLGLLIPLILGMVEAIPGIKAKQYEILGWVEPLLVLGGGYILRHVVVYSGQIIYPILTVYPG